MTTRAAAKTATRQALADAAVELVRAQGYRATTVDEIAERAGVSERTFFRHFPSKEAALFSREELFLAELRDQLASVPLALPALSAARRALVRTGRFIQAEGDWLLEFAGLADEVPAIREHIDAGVGRLMNQELSTWASRRLGRPATVDATPTVLAGVASVCAEAGMQRWLAHHGAIDLPDAIDEAFDHVVQLVRDS